MKLRTLIWKEFLKAFEYFQTTEGKDLILWAWSRALGLAGSLLGALSASELGLSQSRGPGAALRSSQVGRKFILKWERLIMLQWSPRNRRRAGLGERQGCSGPHWTRTLASLGNLGVTWLGKFPEETWVRYHYWTLTVAGHSARCFAFTILFNNSTLRWRLLSSPF